MEDKRTGMSLKYKLLALLTIIPVISLSIYFFLATEEFKEDKIAYVHDSSAAVAKSLSTQVRAEVNTYLEKIKPVVQNFDQVEKVFTATGKRLFENADRVDALILLQKNERGQYVRLGELQRSNNMIDTFMKDQNLQSKLRAGAVKSGIDFAAPEYMEKYLALSYLIGDPGKADHVVVIGLLRASELRSSFIDSKLYRVYLIGPDGTVFLGPSDGQTERAVFAKILTNKLPEGSLDVPNDGGKLAGYSDVGIADLVVTSIVRKKDALRAVDKLILKSVTFFFALISATVIISLFASIQMTSALRDLYEGTKKIAKGEFDVRVKRKTNDEIGGLADGFNFMAEEVSRLMSETKQKARMESELATVKLVQETLFPEPESKVGPFKVIGHFEPASECGGDWWNYSRIGDKLYLWIGDATGHGAPAAMVTSAAKSAATIVEDLPFISPGKALEIMNKAIHETSKGKILMTFFVGALDLKTGEMIYANASHEPPYVIRGGTGGKITKKNLDPLIDASGARLGDQRDSIYKEASTFLKPGESILFYTDGIVDLQNPAGESWGERGFLRTIVESAQQGPALSVKMQHMKHKISEYRADKDLIDDITLFMCQYDQEAA